MSKKPCKKWSQESLEAAVNYIKSNESVSLREAARLHNVPVEILR